jgi:hypothetical protein
MAVITSWRIIDAYPGVDFNQSYPTINTVAASATSATGNLEEANMPGDALGTVRKGPNDSEWVLVKASTTITQFNLIVFDDSFNANNFTTALALTGFQIAACQLQPPTTSAVGYATSADPTSNPVFWAAIKGVGMQLNVSGSAGTGVNVNNGTTPGSISISSTGTHINGIALYVSATGGQPQEVTIFYPRVASL